MKSTLNRLIGTLLVFTFTACSKSDSPTPHAGTIIGVSGSLARFALASDHLYTVSNSTLSLYNVSESRNPVFQNDIRLGSGVETLFSHGNNLFIGMQNGMEIYDITHPAQPSILSRYNHITSCDPVVANDQYAFVTMNNGTTCSSGLNQLDVIDISNLTNPVLAKSYAMTKPKGLAIDGNNLFVCDGGIKFYDAGDPRNLILKSHIIIEANDVIAHNGILMVIGDDGLYQYDYSQGNLTLLSKIPTT